MIDLLVLLKRSETKILTLLPALQVRAFEMIKRAYKIGYPIQVTQALRTIAEQEALYAQGRTAPGPVVTWVKHSYHNFSLAFDIVILTPDGTDCIWDDEKGYAAIGQIGKDLGLEWGGDWDAATRDQPHFQLTYGLSIQDLVNGATIPVNKDMPNYDQPTKVRKKPMEQWLKDTVIGVINDLAMKGKISNAQLWIDKVNNDEDIAPLAVILINRMS